MITDAERADHYSNRARILEEIIELKEIISELDKNRSKNFKVFDGNYLVDGMVWLTKEVVQIEDERGLSMYYRGLKEKLERVVNDEIIDWGLLIDAHSPDYLKQFLRFNIRRYS